MRLYVAGRDAVRDTNRICCTAKFETHARERPVSHSFTYVGKRADAELVAINVAACTRVGVIDARSYPRQF